MSQQAAKRARRNAANGYGNLPPQKRPHFKKTNASVAHAKLMEQVRKERERIQRKGKKS